MEGGTTVLLILALCLGAQHTCSETGSSERVTEKGGSNPDIEQASLNVEMLHENGQTPEVVGKESSSQDDKEHSSVESLDHVEDPHTQLGAEEPREAPSPGEVLPERPLQLVRPDPTKHRKLELVAQNVKHLYHINTAVAVVAVVGKFHSGKSFLLNQLMGKPGTGFTIGPTVRPQTMGIWMWGKPMTMQLPSGEPLSVVFLDTEGFAANNISETYDAKIFSVATLLSSYLIYNSVKIIDQADIDYLELLARRTQLFALRSQMAKSHWFDEFNHDLLKFPPLMWVVQDFVQTTEDEESPREWLHRIMETSSREAGDYDINLMGIFESVDCHTLFLPATKKHLLQDLSKAADEELTPEYKEERDQLIADIKQGLVPKEKNGRPITGPELATLLEILVTAANEGSLAEIPGRWEVFIDQLKANALDDCVVFYESDMNVIQRQYKYGAINETELQLWHESAVENARTLLRQLLFGLEAATADALEGLAKSVMEKFEKLKDLNSKKIKLKCSEVQRRIEIKAEEELQELVFPMKTEELQRSQESVKKRNVQAYKDDVGHLSDNPAFQRHLEQLKTGLGYICNAVTLKNNEAMEALLQAAIDQAVAKFREASKNQNRIPRTTDAFKKVVETAHNEARKVFDMESELAHDETLYQPFLGLLKTRLQEETEVCRRDNLQLIKTSCQSQAVELAGNFRHNTGPTKLILPLNDTELEARFVSVLSVYINRRLQAEKETAFKTYAQTQSAFEDTSTFSEVKEYLAAQLEEISQQRQEENYQAYIKEVEVPLNTAKKLILLSADKYDTVFALRQYMKKVCLLNLDEGKAKGWQQTLKETIAEKFIQNSQELQDVIKSKGGLWSTIKGFWQWLYWLILGGNT